MAGLIVLTVKHVRSGTVHRQRVRSTSMVAVTPIAVIPAASAAANPAGASSRTTQSAAAT